jgi:hypothetical protein
VGIDVSSLSPAAQKQVLAKLGRQAAEKELRSKYGAKPDTRGNIRFDSRKEARRYDELMLMLQAGRIRNLKLQPQYTLQESYVTPEGVRVRAIRYVADFSYEQYTAGLIAPEGGGTWLPIVEDVKSRATKTRQYEIKRKVLLAKFGIRVREI